MAKEPADLGHFVCLLLQIRGKFCEKLCVQIIAYVFCLFLFTLSDIDLYIG